MLGKAKSVSLTIDGKPIRAVPGEKVLWAALDNNIYIPNLCAIREKSKPFASCRLCFVEIEGKDNPVTACTTPVAEGMVVNTKGAKAVRLARTALALLLASHPVDCAHCPKSGSCELQTIAKHLGVKLKTKRFRKIVPELPIDSSSALFIYDPNKCVLCGRCVWVCQEKLGKGTIGFAYRGFRRMVTTFGDEPVGRSCCQDCSECVDVCPVGALLLREDTAHPQATPKTRQ
ncbi:MAG TPA: ferredoxin [Chloroflexi bacterium]|nr:ferredoxin [Chloroflexota bacterium]